MSFLSTVESLLPLANATWSTFTDGCPHQYTVLFSRIPRGDPPLHLSIPYKIGFSYVLAGRGTFTQDGVSYPLTAGSLFVIDASHDHLLESDPTTTWCECSLAMCRRSANHLRELDILTEHRPQVDVGLNPSLLEAYRRCYLQIKALTPDPDARGQVVAACIDVLLARRQAIAEGNDDFLNQAKRLLAQHCCARDAADRAADALGLGYHTFRRRFRQQAGESPGAWQIRYRIGLAYDLLQRMSIDDVAEQLGYADRFTFSRQFKQVTGTSPGRARQELPIDD